MGKKKLWSAVSAMKLSEAIMANYAGRLGGVVGLDRDLQLMLYNMASEKAKYWENKAGIYHRVREAVAGILAGTNVPRHRYVNYYALAEKVARAYAMYPDDVAEAYVDAIQEQFSDLELTYVTQIIEKAKEIGKNARPLYHLQPA